MRFPLRRDFHILVYISSKVTAAYVKDVSTSVDIIVAMIKGIDDKRLLVFFGELIKKKLRRIERLPDCDIINTVSKY